MKNRICPSEEFLSSYISGILSPENKIPIEKHLAVCRKCRILLAETHDITSKSAIQKIKSFLYHWFRKNIWLMGALTALYGSFLFQKYFLQFLMVSFLMGMKWIIDAKMVKTLVMIHEAWKSGKKETKDRTFS